MKDDPGYMIRPDIKAKNVFEKKVDHDPDALAEVMSALWEAGMIRSDALAAIEFMERNGVVFKKVAKS